MRAFLIHGGIWEDMDSDRFWHRPGVTAGLRERGIEAITPDRLPEPPDWQSDVDHLAKWLPDTPTPMVAASYGGTVGICLAAQYPDRVSRLLLAWPATCGDTARDARFASYMAQRGAGPDTVTDILAGETLRGVTDAQLAALAGLPTAVVFAPSGSPAHRPHTAHAVVRLTGAENLGEFGEPPRPDFAGERDRFCEVVAGWLAGDGTIHSGQEGSV